jgi:NADH-quinone oxidoreductase subunit N
VNVDFSTWTVLVPLLAASLWGLVVLVAEMFATNRRFTGIAWLTIIALADIAIATSWVGTGGDAFTGTIVLDGFAAYFNYLLVAIGVLAVLLSVNYLPEIGVTRGEYYPLMLFSIAGLMVMAAASDLIVMFLGLETMSMAVYVLTGIRKHELRSNEAALKYFLMGAFASAILLYGVALLYLLCGTTGLAGIGAHLAAAPLVAGDSLLLFTAVGLILIGLGFKVAAVPFHLWAPDVYEGAPTSVTAFMATAVKAGAFAALLRAYVVALGPVHDAMWPLLWIGAAATMTVGNFVALQQTSLKRMLAYSSVAHTGYLLVGVTAGTTAAASSVLFYLAAYGAMNLTAFAVMISLARRDHGYEQISNLAGLGQSRPMVAVAMTVAMLSLIGMPPLAGFVGKFYLFSAALDAGFAGLVVVAVANSVVSAAYYLGVVRTMWFDAPEEVPAAGGGHAAAALAIAVSLTLFLGIAPAAVLGAAQRALAAVALG